jgi:hypothetical protein
VGEEGFKRTGSVSASQFGDVVIAHQGVGMDSQTEARRHTAEQLQEIPVCVIARKQRSAVDSTIHDVVPSVLYYGAQWTTHTAADWVKARLTVNLNVDY